MRHQRHQASERVGHPEGEIIGAIAMISLPLLGLTAWGVYSFVQIFTM